MCGHLSVSHQPDAAGFLTYAANGTTAGTLMYGYKDERATSEQHAVIKLLAHRGFRHAGCVERLVGAPITHFATVPSTRGRESHPLAALIAPFVGWPQQPLTHVSEVTPMRQTVQPELFDSPAIPSGAHVLLVDDTWTSGNKPLSATAALRRAGADRVSLLCLSRWLGFDFIQRPSYRAMGLHKTLLEQQVYDMAICPFTGGICP